MNNNKFLILNLLPGKVLKKENGKDIIIFIKNTRYLTLNNWSLPEKNRK